MEPGVSSLPLRRRLSLIKIVVPWGRYMPLRKDLEAGAKTEAEGGTGVASKFWDWTEEQIKPFE
jgi:hypothetical protein